MKYLITFSLILLITATFPARASLFNVAFTTSGDGAPGDSISGNLIGLQNGTNQDPLQIQITQAPASLGLNASVATPYTLTVANYMSTDAAGDMLSTTSTGVYGFKISLAGGVETVQAPLDLAFTDASGQGIAFNYYSTAIGTGYNAAFFNGVYDYGQTGFSGTTFTAFAPVPEPKDWSLWILMGFTGLVAFRKLRAAYSMTL